MSVATKVLRGDINVIAQFESMIAYGQVLIFLRDLPRPGLLWSAEHGAQGFAWSPGIVSFGVPDPDNGCLIRVTVADEKPTVDAALWAVCVPFDVPAEPLKIGTVGDMVDVAVPPGRYDLVFRALPGESIKDGAYSFVLDFVFCSVARPDFAILKRGTDLATDVVLRKDAEHA